MQNLQFNYHACLSEILISVLKSGMLYSYNFVIETAIALPAEHLQCRFCIACCDSPFSDLSPDRHQSRLNIQIVLETSQNRKLPTCSLFTGLSSTYCGIVSFSALSARRSTSAAFLLDQRIPSPWLSILFQQMSHIYLPAKMLARSTCELSLDYRSHHNVRSCRGSQ